MEFRDVQGLMRLRQALLDRGVTPTIEKKMAQFGPVGTQIECVVLSVQFFDEYSGQPGTVLEFGTAVSEFYTYKTTQEAEVTKADQMIAWIESH